MLNYSSIKDVRYAQTFDLSKRLIGYIVEFTAAIFFNRTVVFIGSICIAK